nr:unnamed protein product [Digitaria exilis]
MKREIAKYVSECDTCQRVKASHLKVAGTLQPLPIPSWKWEDISMDFIVGLPKTPKGMTPFGVNQILEDMLRACVIHYGKNSEKCLSLAEFSYNNSYQASLKMAPFEALYGRRCRTPLCWSQAGERYTYGPDLVKEAEEKKSYFDQRWKPLQFEVGDHVYLKVFPIKSVQRFGLKGKLAPRYIGPYEITQQCGPVAYRVRLHEKLSAVHNVFHVSQLKKCLRVPTEVHPIKILDEKERKTRRKEVKMYKIQWSHHSEDEATWETKDYLKKNIPDILPKTKNALLRRKLTAMQVKNEELVTTVQEATLELSCCPHHHKRREFLKGRPPNFSRAKDPMEDEEWIKAVERQLDIAQYHYREKITWQFSDDFRAHHVPEGLMIMKKEFLALTQKGIRVTTYHDKFLELACYAPDEVSTDRKRQTRFRGGLDALQLQLMCITFATFGEWVDGALMVEHKHREIEDKKRKIMSQQSDSNVHPHYNPQQVNHSALARSAPGRSSAATWPASGGGRAELAEPRRRVALVALYLSNSSRAVTSPSFARFASRRGVPSWRSDAAVAARSRAHSVPLHAKGPVGDLPLLHAMIFDAQSHARALPELAAPSMATATAPYSVLASAPKRFPEHLTPLPFSPHLAISSPCASLPELRGKIRPPLSTIPKFLTHEARTLPGLPFPHFSRAIVASPARNLDFPQIAIFGRRSSLTSRPHSEPSPRSTEHAISFLLLHWCSRTLQTSTRPPDLTGVEVAAAAPPLHRRRRNSELPRPPNRHQSSRGEPLVLFPHFPDPNSPSFGRRSNADDPRTFLHRLRFSRRPVLTVQLLDKQPRLTVTSLEDKRQALLAGLGVATMPYPFVEKDIAEGRLRVVSPEYTSEVDIIMAWRRDSMGEAKSWCLREIPKLFAHHNK